MEFFNIGFDEDKTSGILVYNWVEKKIEIGTYFEYSETQKEKIENTFEGLLSHETIHGIIHEIDCLGSSSRFDNLGEYLGNTPYSFPQSSTGSANK